MKVAEVFAATKAAAAKYIRFTLFQRAGLADDGSPNRHASGSIYPDFTVGQLEEALITVDWQEVVGHPAAAPDTRVFWAHLPGLSGMRDLSSIPDQTPVLLVAPRRGGNLFPTVAMEGGRTRTELTICVIGVKDPAKPLFMGLHAGDLVPRSELAPEQVPEGQRHITAAAALALGFTHAKVVNPVQAAAA